MNKDSTINANVQFGIRANIPQASGIFGIYNTTQYDKRWSGTTITTNDLPQYLTVAVEFPKTITVGGATYQYVNMVWEGIGTPLTWTEESWGARARLDGASAYQIRYELTRVSIDTIVSPDGAGYTVGQGTYPVHSSVLLQAYPNHGYQCIGWWRNNVQVSDTRTYRIDDAYTNQTYEARFRELPKYIVDTYIGSGGGAVDYIDHHESKYYYPGDTVKLRAIPSSGYRFVRWSDGSTNPYKEFTMGNAPVTLTVYFEEDIVSVTVESDFPEAPLVAIYTSGLIEWVKSKTINVIRGTRVTVEAKTSYGGFYFKNWNNSISSRIYTFNASADTQTLHAYYDTKSVKVYLREGVGGETTPRAGTYEVESPATFHVESAPFEGYNFISYWVQEGAKEPYYITGHRSYDFIITETTEIKPVFEELKCIIVVQPETDGTGSTVPSGTHTYSFGDSFHATAHNSVPGYAFDHWWSSAVIPLEDPTNPEINIAELRRGHEGTYNAVFKPTSTEKRYVTLGEDPNYPGGYVSITRDPSVHYREPTRIEFTKDDSFQVHAQPDTGYELLAWSDGVIPTNPRTITANENKTVLAQFVQKHIYTITLIAEPSGSGRFITTGLAYEGATVTVQAIANEGYSFRGWSDGVQTATRPVYVTGDITLIGYFTSTSRRLNPGIINYIINRKRGKQNVRIEFSK